MSTSAPEHPTTRSEASIIDSAGVDDTWQGRVVATRAEGDAGEKVFLTSDNERAFLLLSPTQAADLAAVLLQVSGMATSTREARHLARVHREHLAGNNISMAQASRETGITRYRLRKILLGEQPAPMTKEEHKALSELLH